MEKRKACFYFGSPSESNWEKVQGHNERTTYVPHLLPDEFSLFNEYWGDSSKKFAQQVFDSKFQEFCADRKGKKPIISNNIREAVINCDMHTTLEELIELGDAVFSEFGYVPLSISIHKDEGVLKRIQDGKIFTPQIDFVVDENGDTWELEGGGYENGRLRKARKTGKKFFDVHSVNEFEPIRNYHAHMTFCTLRDPSKWRRSGYSMGTQDLKKIQNITAEILELERGTPGSKRLDWRAFKMLKYAQNEIDSMRDNTQKAELSSLSRMREMLQNTIEILFQPIEEKVKRCDENAIEIVRKSKAYFKKMANSGTFTPEFFENFENLFDEFSNTFYTEILNNNIERNKNEKNLI